MVRCMSEKRRAGRSAIDGACPVRRPAKARVRRKAREFALIEPLGRFRAHSFTLIELLVVVAIIGILASMLLPSLQKAKEKANGAICLGNLKQTGVMHLLYEKDYDGYFMTASFGAGNTWSTTCIEQKYAQAPADIFVCPTWPPNTFGGDATAAAGNNRYYLTYGMRYLDLASPTQFSPIARRNVEAKDTLSNILFVADTQSLAPNWTLGHQMYRLDLAFNYFIHARHSRRANALFFDGHAQSCGPPDIGWGSASLGPILY